MTHRQAILAACAMCHILWDRAEDNTERGVVVQIEEYADGKVTRGRVVRNLRLLNNSVHAHKAEESLIALYATNMLITSFLVSGAEPEQAIDAFLQECADEIPGYEDLLTNITTASDEELNVTDELTNIAMGVYYERNSDYTLDRARLDVLADALEEAGAVHCVSALRECGRVYKGFWPVDKVML